MESKKAFFMATLNEESPRIVDELNKNTLYEKTSVVFSLQNHG